MKQEDPKAPLGAASGYATAVDAALGIADSIRDDTYIDNDPVCDALGLGRHAGLINTMDAGMVVLAAEVRRLSAALVTIRDGMPNWSAEVREAWAVQLARETLGESHNRGFSNAVGYQPHKPESRSDG